MEDCYSVLVARIQELDALELKLRTMLKDKNVEKVRLERQMMDLEFGDEADETETRDQLNLLEIELDVVNQERVHIRAKVDKVLQAQTSVMEALKDCKELDKTAEKIIEFDKEHQSKGSESKGQSSILPSDMKEAVDDISLAQMPENVVADQLPEREHQIDWQSAQSQACDEEVHHSHLVSSRAPRLPSGLPVYKGSATGSITNAQDFIAIFEAKLTAASYGQIHWSRVLPSCMGNSRLIGICNKWISEEWSSCKSKFLKHQQSSQIKNYLREQLDSFEQEGKESVVDYIDRVLDLVDQVPGAEDDNKYTQRMRLKLRDSKLRDKVESVVILGEVQGDTFDMLKMADLIKSFALRLGTDKQLSRKFSGKCNYCGIVGHKEADCRRKKASSGDSRGSSGESGAAVRRTQDNSKVETEKKVEKRSCHSCGGIGHLSYQCTKGKQKSEPVRQVKEADTNESQQSEAGKARRLTADYDLVTDVENIFELTDDIEVQEDQH